MTTNPMVHCWHVLGMTEGLYTFYPLFSVVSQPVVWQPCPKNAHRSRSQVECPPLPLDYQQNIREVDRGDQMIGCYNIGQWSRKLWKRVFSYMIECALLNAYILESHTNQSGHSQEGREKRDYLKFQLDLANQLIGNHTSGKLPQHQYGNCDRLNTDLGHWPVQETHKLWCVVCSATIIQLHLPPHYNWLLWIMHNICECVMQTHITHSPFIVIYINCTLLYGIIYV